MCGGYGTALNRNSHCCSTGGNTVVDTLIAVKADLYVCTCAGQDCHQHTDTLLEVERKTLSIKLGDVMTEALIDALADTVAAVKAKTLYESLNDIKADTLLQALNHTLAKDESQNTRRRAAQCRG